MHTKEYKKEQKLGKLKEQKGKCIRNMTAKRITAKLCGQKKLAPDIYSMWISCGQMAEEALPGQFVILYCKDSGRKLGRPISICEIDREQGRLRMVYRTVGTGTKEFSKLKEQEEITVFGPLGNGYGTALDFAEGKNDVLPDSLKEVRTETASLEEGSDQAPASSFVKKEKEAYRHGILVAGGIGIPPMLELAKQLPGKVTAVLGYRDSQMFLKDELEKYAEVWVATEDGSFGTKGNVLDVLKQGKISGDFICACGPKPMLKALKRYAEEQNLNAWMSLEEKMACGIGICLGCAVPIQTGEGVVYKRVCKEGPVFHGKEIVFHE